MRNRLHTSTLLSKAVLMTLLTSYESTAAAFFDLSSIIKYE